MNSSGLSFFFFKQKTAYEILAWTGVQTCALPIFRQRLRRAIDQLVHLTGGEEAGGRVDVAAARHGDLDGARRLAAGHPGGPALGGTHQQARRSGERRVGKEGRSRGAAAHSKKK